MKKPAVYEMRRPDWRSYFELHVHKSAREMRKALAADPLASFVDDGETAGIVMPVSTIDWKTGERGGLFAYMHLNEERLGAGVVAHECLHAALAHERMTMFEMHYGNECGSDEERLAYLLTDIVRCVYDALHKNGHIKPNLPGKAGGNTAGKARTRSAKGAKEN